MTRTNTLRDNIISLFILQGAEYILPLITVPYLVRILGPEKFGLIAFAQAFIQYFVLLTDYGFNLSATRLISIHRHDINRRSQIFWSTIWAKIGLMVVSFCILVSVVFSFQKFRLEWPLYFISFITVTGNVLFPVWYFQGMERMKLISALNISVKVISVAAIFLLVRNEGDYLIVAIIQSGGMVVGGFLSVYFVSKLGQLRFLWPIHSLLIETLKDGWHVFISTAGISLYVSSTAFILGLISGNVAVGYFSAAQKIIKAVQGLITPVSIAIYPRISALAIQSREKALMFIRKTLNWIGSGSLIISIILLLLAKPAVLFLLGHKYVESIAIVRWMAFMPFIVGLSNIFGVQTMVTFGMKKQFSRILLLAGVFNLVILFPLIWAAGAEGAAISLMLTEVIVTVTMAIILQRNGFYIYSPHIVKT